MEKTNRGSFKGSIGFVLAAAGSAVGLGNIWRFPYLAARDGGGIFLLVYLILAITFGFTMLTSETAIGRKTKQSPLTAYSKLKKGWGWLGIFASIVPFMIMPYYCVIGGWVLKYFIAFLTGQGIKTAEDTYFTGFITAQYEPIVMLLIFLLVCAVIIYVGVEGGIERFSKIIMPVLLVLVIGIAIYSLTLKSTNDAGVKVTGLQGLKVLFIPNFKGMTFKSLGMVIMDAMGQLFYSLSVAMGIMIAYGSYVKDEDNLVKAVNQIEIFDTAVAFLAGIMIIPAVYVFMGTDGMAAGPSLMFVALPKIFVAMGPIGNIVGTLFFAMVLFAAITSAISILEAIVSSLIDRFGMSRQKATIIESILALIIAVIVCLGYNVLYFEVKLPNGSVAQILDIMDYISNNVLMPVVAIGTCILVGWIVKPKTVIEELTKNGERFGRKPLYIVMIKFISPLLLVILLLMSLGIL
ncbi:MAG TPA: sodium-dependent transporter [Lachnospiraceae bacterium]|nr:sodium-dependent transporter [Lachnospiraceae bacterium]